MTDADHVLAPSRQPAKAAQPSEDPLDGTQEGTLLGAALQRTLVSPSRLLLGASNKTWSYRQAKLLLSF